MSNIKLTGKFVEIPIDENEIDHECNKCGKKAISEDHLTIYGLCGNCNEDAVKETQGKE